LRSSDSWVEPEHASMRGSHLPCPSTPLQSMTAAASRRIPSSGPGSRGVCAGQEHPGTRVAYCATGAGRHPKVMGRLLGPRGGRTQPLARVDRNARSGCRSVPGSRTEARESGRRPARGQDEHRTSSLRTSLLRHRSAGVARASRCRSPPKWRSTRRNPSGPAWWLSPPKWLSQSS
jgi:hypothetical protein